MLNRSDRDQTIGLSRSADKEFEGSGIDFERLVKAGRRQIWVLLLFCLLSLASGLAYLTHVVPRYTATAVVLIGSAKDKTGLSASIADLTYDAGAIDSQLEVLKSEGIAQTVISNLNLEASPDLDDPQPGLVQQLVGRVRAFLHLDPRPDAGAEALAADPTAKRQALVSKLKSNLDVRRIGRSYVINIDYTSPDRLKAAEGANAFAAAYINDQLEARFDSMRQAGGWLEKRISDLKQKSMVSDLAVQKFKSERGLLTADGKLVSDQQLSELSTQLILAQSERARAEARFSQISALLEKKDVNGVVSGTLESPVINDLRQKYLAAAQLESDINALGPGRPQAANQQRTMDDYTKQIFGEMTRIAAAYKSDAEVARARETSLRDSMASLAGQADARAQAMVELRELQRESDSYQNLYATFLQRLQQVQEGQTIPESEARIITPASPPPSPTYPKRAVIMSLSLVFGLMAGVGVGAFREVKDNVFRTASDVTDGLQMEFLGMLPAVKGGARPAQPAETRTDPRLVDSSDPVLRYATDQPLTSFTETLRSIKVAVDLQLGPRTPKVIGVVSVAPDEGKSTVSKNFASLVAHLGFKVLLIDGDLHHPGLTNALAGHVSEGLLEVVRGDVPLSDAVLYEPDSGLSFLPTVLKARLYHASQTIASEGMRNLLAQASTEYDYIIVDLPPIGPVVDVRAAAAIFDAFVFVVRWGKTVRDVVETTLMADKEIASRCVGVVYNRVQINKIKLYEGSDAKAFYHRDFGKYYSS